MNPRIVIAGGTGFVGQALAAALARDGYSIVLLSRRLHSADPGATIEQWDGKNAGPWAHSLEDAAAVINLAGRNVNCRPTPQNRREILDSRVGSVRALSAAMLRCDRPPPVWIQASGIGYYGDSGDQIRDEDSPPGNDFFAEVCQAWEGALAEAPLPDTRKVIMRLGVVLGREGGALPMLEKLARWFMGGAAGSGRQYLSWIHLDDVVRSFRFALEQETLAGPCNASAPSPVTNTEFMRELRRAVHRPWSPPVPAPLARVGAWLVGTNGDLALQSTRALPARLLDHGFDFRFPQLRDALAHLYAK